MIVCGHDRFGSCRVVLPRRNSASPVTSKAADEAMEPNDLALSDSLLAPARRAESSIKSCALFISLSAISKRFRDSLAFIAEKLRADGLSRGALQAVLLPPQGDNT